MKSLRIIDKNFVLLGETNKYLSYVNEVDYNGVGVCEIHINRYAKHADKFQIDNIVFLANNTNEAYIIKQRQIKLDENGKPSEIWVIRGYQLKTMLNDQLIFPLVGFDFSTKEGLSEEVVRQYVSDTLINGDPSRKIPNLVLGTNQGRGTVRRHDARYDVLGSFIKSILDFDSLGWDVRLNTNDGQFVFEVLSGDDRSENSAEPIILSTDFTTLKNMQYSESKIDYYNVAIVGGPGEGKDRVIVEVGSATPGERREIFLDAREIPLLNEDGTPRPMQDVIRDLTEYGENFLLNSTQQNYASGELLPKKNLQYGTNYKLGDIVTIQNKKWGVQLNARITKVRKAIEPGLETITHTFDNDQPTIITKLKTSLSNIQGEILK